MAAAPATHTIDWYAVSRDANRIRRLKFLLRELLRRRYPRANLLLDDQEIFLFSMRKRFRRRNTEDDTESWRRFSCQNLIPSHLREWFENGPEDLIESLSRP